MHSELRRTGARALALAAIAALAMIAIAGCGTSSNHADPSTGASLPIDSSATPQPGGVAPTGTVIVQVGNTSITKSQLESRLAIETHGEEPAPVPPAFTRCIAGLAALAKKKGTALPSRTQLKASCSQRYEELLKAVLTPLISADWVIGEAHDEGYRLTDHEVRHYFGQLALSEFGSTAKLHAFLGKTGEKLSDVLFNIKEQMADQVVLGKVKNASVRPITPVMIARYYVQHKAQYAIGEQRDLGLIRTKTASLAARVKQELRSGASFPTVAKKFSNQPIYTSSGLLHGLEPHVYAEQAINDAIFSAKPHVLSGPVRLNIDPHVHYPKPRDIREIDGYYIFEVNAIRAPYVQPLAKVKASIAQLLPTLLYKQGVFLFAKKYRAKWIARTNCRPGYVIQKCRQFRPAPGEPPEDPYTIR